MQFQLEGLQVWVFQVNFSSTLNVSVGKSASLIF